MHKQTRRFVTILYAHICIQQPQPSLTPCERAWSVYLYKKHVYTYEKIKFPCMLLSLYINVSMCVCVTAYMHTYMSMYTQKFHVISACYILLSACACMDKCYVARARAHTHTHTHIHRRVPAHLCTQRRTCTLVHPHTQSCGYDCHHYLVCIYIRMLYTH
jgi:hypothetical protein